LIDGAGAWLARHAALMRFFRNFRKQGPFVPNWRSFGPGLWELFTFT
jgi:hypothetical protein